MRFSAIGPSQTRVGAKFYVLADGVSIAADFTPMWVGFSCLDGFNGCAPVEAEEIPTQTFLLGRYTIH